MAIQPLLAEKAETSEDGKTWTITLNSKIAFSNGNPVTAEMVAKNLQRLAEVNKRFDAIKDYKLETPDDKTLAITTPEVYPTLLNDLASAEVAILDLDATKDFDNAPVGTGPFVIKTFEPEGKVEVARNEKYWNGDVKLDGAIFFYMKDNEAKLMAMQSGEIDTYQSVTEAAKKIFAAEPEKYTLTEIPATRLQFYALNKKTLDENVRKAVNLTVDCEAVATYLKGTVSAAVGPFSPNAAYGKVTKPAPDPEQAKKVLEDAGYKLNTNGVFEKDGKPLTLNICYYAKRSLDSIAILMQEQLKAVGIDAKLTVQEDPDATYVKTGDYDVALYCIIADKAGDPFYGINALFSQKSKWAIAGFKNDECEKLVGELRYEKDPVKRAELANKIVQIVIDDNAFGFVGLFNKITVAAKGVSNISENCPFDFYDINASSDKA